MGRDTVTKLTEGSVRLGTQLGPIGAGLDQVLELREHKVSGVLADVVAEQFDGSVHPTLGILSLDGSHRRNQQRHSQVSPLLVVLESLATGQHFLDIDKVTLVNELHQVPASGCTNQSYCNVLLDCGRGVASLGSSQCIAAPPPSTRSCICHDIITIRLHQPLIGVLVGVAGDCTTKQGPVTLPVRGNIGDKGRTPIIVFRVHAPNPRLVVMLPLVVSKAISQRLLQRTGIRCPLRRIAGRHEDSVRVDHQVTDQKLGVNLQQGSPNTWRNSGHLIGKEQCPGSSQSTSPLGRCRHKVGLVIRQERDAAEILRCMAGTNDIAQVAAPSLGQLLDNSRLANTGRAREQDRDANPCGDEARNIWVRLGPVLVGIDGGNRGNHLGFSIGWGGGCRGLQTTGPGPASLGSCV